MAGIKVHGIPPSPGVMRVLLTLYEKGLDFQFVPVDMSAGQHKKEPFLSLNPFAQVPAFEDGDLKLFESRAISHYVADEYHNKGNQLLYPNDRKTKALTYVWLAAEGHQFDPVGSMLTEEIIVKPMCGQTTDLAIVEEYETKLDKVLDVYEAHLGKNKYLAGDCFTLADLHHVPVIHYLLETRTKSVFDKHPKVCEWFSVISAREAWAKVLAMQEH